MLTYNKEDGWGCDGICGTCNKEQRQCCGVDEDGHDLEETCAD